MVIRDRPIFTLVEHWQSITNQPTFNASTMILLTDGRVMVHETQTKHWHALTPDPGGSYSSSTSTWTTLADMTHDRLYFASGVLRDGRVFVVGGEYSDGNYSSTAVANDTNTGEIYDPVHDQWMAMRNPPWSNLGDAPCCVLPNGKVLFGNINGNDCLIYDPDTDSWTTTGSKHSQAGEETWVLLPDDTVLTVQNYSAPNSEKYIISSGTWQSEGNTQATLIDARLTEIGPAMLMYNGKVIYFGAENVDGHGETAIYTPPATPTGHGTWTKGPDIKDPKDPNTTYVANDSPAVLLPNGNVLFVAAPYVQGGWGRPDAFFEYSPASNTISRAPTPANNNEERQFVSRMLLLPTGQVLFNMGTNKMEIYTPTEFIFPQESWRPTVTDVSAYGIPWFGEFVLQGTKLNGFSQASIYGDDVSNATNYPLVQVVNPANNRAYFLRTYQFSTMGVATGSSLQSCRFKTGTLPSGTYDLYVIANGIASHPVAFSYRRPTKAPIFDTGSMKREFDFLGKEIYEGDQYKWWEEVVDPEVVELQGEVKQLQNSVRRLESLIPARELPQVGKQVKQRVSEDGQKGSETVTQEMVEEIIVEER